MSWKNAPLAPQPKVAATGVVGALVTLIVYEAARFGFEVSGAEGAALAVLLAFLAGYLKR